MIPVLIFIVAVLLLLVGAYYLSRALFKKAVRQVVAIFRRLGATSPKNAKTLLELGLVRAGLGERLLRGRDYKPYALRMLAQANVVREVDGGRAYLSEDELERSPVKKFARVKDPKPPEPAKSVKPAKPTTPVKPAPPAAPAPPAPPAEG